MTVKQFLNRVRGQEYKVKTLELELDKTKYEIYHIKSPPLKERVQTSHQGDISELVERMEREQDKVNEEWDILIDLRAVAKKIISMLEDPKKEAILRRRYILCQKWEVIAVDMEFDLRYVYKLHGEALLELENSAKVKNDIK